MLKYNIDKIINTLIFFFKILKLVDLNLIDKKNVKNRIKDKII